MTFTVLTPTYNRLSLLGRCYKSLLRQTTMDFEWLVVDDGSTDGTSECVEGWSRSAPFRIRLLKKDNGGKHTAINVALDSDLRRYVILLDSDDALADGGIEVLARIMAGTAPAPVGVIGNRYDIHSGALIGKAIPDGVARASGRDLRERYNVQGDTLRVYRSDVLRQHRFPEFPGERFVPENVIFDPIDKDHELQVTREVIYLCEYQETGLSAAVMRHRALSPRGFAASLESSAWIARKPSAILEYTLKYQVWCKQFIGCYGLHKFRRKIVYLVCLPGAVALNALRRPRFIFSTRALLAKEESARGRP
jgi:glycosyltransferase involved in cell wall biosynthesis